MPTWSITLENPAPLMAALQALGPQAQGAAAGVLRQEAELLMTQAKGLTPVDTGALRASGHVQPPEETATGVAVTLGFGGPVVEYAVYVHEDLAASHPVGQAKFLEQPVLTWAGQAESVIADALRGRLGRP